MLRPYQIDSINQARDIFFTRNEKECLIWLATGLGKTVIFCEILKHFTGNAIVLVRGRKLVDQASARLRRENVPHGVHMRGHWNYNPSANIQVCSIDTIHARGIRPKADLIIIDEAHLSSTAAYEAILKDYADALVIDVTATPYNQQRRIRPFKNIIHEISLKAAIEQGYLSSPIYYCPDFPDLDKVKIQAGEYNQKQLANATDKRELIGNIVEHWRELGENRASICWGVNINHSKHIAARFNAEGISAEHCDAETPDDVRAEIIERSRLGETKVICNVNLFSTGVDMPWLGCGIMARPTQSYILFKQQGGRLMRVDDDKDDFILLDHAGNINRHGFLEDEREPDFEEKRKAVSTDPGIKTCLQCYTPYRGASCPNCGAIKVMEIKQEKSGILRKISTLSPEAEYAKQLRRIKREKKYKRGWCWYRMREKYGDEQADKYFPKRELPDFVKRKLIEKDNTSFLGG